MGLERYLPEEVDEADGQMQVFGRGVWKYVEEEPYKLKQVKAFLEVLAEEFYDLDMLLFHVEQDALGAELMQEGGAWLVLHVDYLGEEFFGEYLSMLGRLFCLFFVLDSHLAIEIAICILYYSHHISKGIRQHQIWPIGW